MKIHLYEKIFCLSVQSNSSYRLCFLIVEYSI